MGIAVLGKGRGGEPLSATYVFGCLSVRLFLEDLRKGNFEFVDSCIGDFGLRGFCVCLFMAALVVFLLL